MEELTIQDLMDVMVAQFNRIDKRLDGMDKRFDVLESDVKDLKSDVKDLKHDVKKIEITIENDLKPKIGVLYEAYESVYEKYTVVPPLVEKVDKLEDEQDLLKKAFTSKIKAM